MAKTITFAMDTGTVALGYTLSVLLRYISPQIDPYIETWTKSTTALTMGIWTHLAVSVQHSFFPHGARFAFAGWDDSILPLILASNLWKRFSTMTFHQLIQLPANLRTLLHYIYVEGSDVLLRYHLLVDGDTSEAARDDIYPKPAIVLALRAFISLYLGFQTGVDGELVWCIGFWILALISMLVPWALSIVYIGTVSEILIRSLLHTGLSAEFSCGINLVVVAMLLANLGGKTTVLQLFSDLLVGG